MDYPQLLEGLFSAWLPGSGSGKRSSYGEFYEVLAGLKSWASYCQKPEVIDLTHSIYVLPVSQKPKLLEWLQQLTAIRNKFNPEGAADKSRQLKIPPVYEEIGRVLVSRRENKITRRLNQEDMHTWLMKLLGQAINTNDDNARRTVLRLLDVVEASTAAAWTIERPTKGMEIRAHLYSSACLKARPGTDEAKPERVNVHSNGLFVLGSDVTVDLPAPRHRKRSTNAFYEPLLLLDKLKIYPVGLDGKPDHSFSFCPLR